MKYLLLFLTIFFNSALATMSNFSIDKTEIDYAKGELITVSFTMAHYENTSYRLYQDYTNGELFLDFDSPSDFDFLAVYPTYTVPIDLSTLTGYPLSKSRTWVLNIREVRRSDNIVKQSQSFNITVKNTYPNDKDSSFRLTDPSGSWYDRTLNGTGFTVMQFQNGTVVQYYGYDSDGKRLWLLSDVIDEAWVRAEAKTLTMYEGKADVFTNFTTPPANVPGIAKWGNIEIRFDNCDVGYAKLSGTDGEQTFNLTKLAAPSGVHCMAQ